MRAETTRVSSEGGAARSPRRPSFGLVLALLALGCNHDSPTAPVDESPPPTASVIVLDSDALVEHQPVIRSLIQTTVEQAGGRLNLERLQFTVSTDVSRTIPGWGLGGYTLGPTEVEIVVDPAFSGLGSVLPSRLPSIVAHEIHHTVRWRSPGPYGTLLDAFVFEGMADHFAIELLGVEVPPWSMVLSPDEIDRFLRRAQPELDSLGFDFNAWFFGTRDLPRWTGYSLGFHLIDQYLARHPERSAADLVHEPSETFRPN